MKTLRIDSLSFALLAVVAGCDSGDDGGDTGADASTSQGATTGETSDDSNGGTTSTTAGSATSTTQGSASTTTTTNPSTTNPDETDTAETDPDETDTAETDTMDPTTGGDCPPAPVVDDPCEALVERVTECGWDEDSTGYLDIYCEDDTYYSESLGDYYACLSALDCASLPVGDPDPGGACDCLFVEEAGKRRGGLAAK